MISGVIRNSLAGVAMLTAALAVPTASKADLLFDITSDHCTGGCLTGQATGGSILVKDLGGGILDFTVTLLNGNKFVSTGLDASFAFNLVGNPLITYTNLTANFAAVGANPQAAGALHVDGTGTFEYGVATTLGNGGGNAVPGPLHFDITAAGLTLASLEANAIGQLFGIDIISGTTGLTGAVDASVSHVVPLPGGLLLLGPVLGMGFLGLRRRRRTGVVPA